MTAYTKMFDADEIQVICQEYAEGMSPQEIADKHFCSRPTIRNYLQRAGVNLRNYHGSLEKSRLASMVLHDWNSDMTADMIVKTYGFGCKVSLYAFIKRFRKKGYKFKRRK